MQHKDAIGDLHQRPHDMLYHQQRQIIVLLKFTDHPQHLAHFVWCKAGEYFVQKDNVRSGRYRADHFKPFLCRKRERLRFGLRPVGQSDGFD